MSAIERAWHKSISWSWLLLPLSLLFYLISSTRRFAFKHGWLPSYRSKLPVLVVGNINVGGSGKTPTVIWLCEELQALGWKPAVVSRGYGAKAPYYPFSVSADSSTAEVGDEPLLIHLRTQCPVVVAPKRAEAVAWLEQNSDADLIITDDGMQHYQLQRDLELVVIDGSRRFGNGLLMPSGPLREPKSRLQTADFLVCNGGKPESGEQLMRLKSAGLRRLPTHDPVSPQQLGKRILAIAGIGHPQRFFDMLSAQQIEVDCCMPLPDHQPIGRQQLNSWAYKFDAVVMTEKDAVKCVSFAPANCYYLPVDAELDGQLAYAIDNKLKKIKQDRIHGIR